MQQQYQQQQQQYQVNRQQMLQQQQHPVSNMNLNAPVHHAAQTGVEDQNGGQQNDVSMAELQQSGGGHAVAQSGFQSRSVRLIQGHGQAQAMSGHGQIQSNIEQQQQHHGW